MNLLFGSNPNVIYTRQTCSRWSSMTTESKRWAQANYFFVHYATCSECQDIHVANVKTYRQISRHTCKCQGIHANVKTYRQVRSRSFSNATAQPSFSSCQLVLPLYSALPFTAARWYCCTPITYLQEWCEMGVCRINTHTYWYTCICIYDGVGVLTYVYIYMCMHIYIHLYIYS